MPITRRSARLKSKTTSGDSNKENEETIVEKSKKLTISRNKKRTSASQDDDINNSPTNVVADEPKKMPAKKAKKEEEVLKPKKVVRKKTVAKIEVEKKIMAPEPVKEEIVEDPKSSESESEQEEEDQKPEKSIKKIKIIGLVPVNLGESDSYQSNSKFCHFGGQDNFRVLNWNENPAAPTTKVGAFHAMLNQTNIGQNNNKYYLVQLLVHMTTGNFFAFFRWGRVGKVAGVTLENHGKNLASALKSFEKKFNDKSKNRFYDVVVHGEEFVKYNNKYELIQMDFGEADNLETTIESEQSNSPSKPKKKKREQAPSELSEAIQKVVKLICDLNRINEKVRELNFDTTRQPLGKITKDQIKKGYEILSEIEQVLKEGNKKGKKSYGSTSLANLSSAYYTKIPHDFGMRTPPIIRDEKHLEQECKLLELMSDAEIISSMIKS